jgi:hypothetical protein
MELVGQWGSRFVRAIGFGSRICVDGDEWVDQNPLALIAGGMMADDRCLAVSVLV